MKGAWGKPGCICDKWGQELVFQSQVTYSVIVQSERKEENTDKKYFSRNCRLAYALLI